VFRPDTAAAIYTWPFLLLAVLSFSAWTLTPSLSASSFALASFQSQSLPGPQWIDAAAVRMDGPSSTIVNWVLGARAVSWSFETLRVSVPAFAAVDFVIVPALIEKFRW